MHITGVAACGPLRGVSSTWGNAAGVEKQAYCNMSALIVIQLCRSRRKIPCSRAVEQRDGCCC